MFIFASMNFLRYEFITKRRSKNIRVKRKMKEKLTFNIFLIACLYFVQEVLQKMVNRIYTAVKLSQEERKMLETIARSYDVTLSDVIRIAIKEYARKHRNVLEKISEEGS